MLIQIDSLERTEDELRKDNSKLKQQFAKALKDLYDAQQKVIEASTQPLESNIASEAINRHSGDQFS